MDPTVYVLRGLPGAGKSQIARLLASATSGVICNADCYLYGEDGLYRWTEAAVARAHMLCMMDFAAALEERQPSIILDNTNMKRKDFAWYRRQARKLGYKISELVVGRPTYEPDMQACAERNSHGAPIDVIKRMSALFRL